MLPVGGGVVQDGIAAVPGAGDAALAAGGDDPLRPGRLRPAFAAVLAQGCHAHLADGGDAAVRQGTEGGRAHVLQREEVLVQPLLLPPGPVGQMILQKGVAGLHKGRIVALLIPGVGEVLLLPPGLGVDAKDADFPQGAVLVNPAHHPAHAVAGVGDHVQVGRDPVVGHDQQHIVGRAVEAHTVMHHGLGGVGEPVRILAPVNPLGHGQGGEDHPGLRPLQAVGAVGEQRVGQAVVLVHGAGQVHQVHPAMPAAEHGRMVVGVVRTLGQLGMLPVGPHHLDVACAHHGPQAAVVKAGIRRLPAAVG